MRLRTFLLLFLVLVVIAVIVFVVVTRGNDLLGIASPDAGSETTDTVVDEPADQEPGVPPPDPTPSVRFENVVVAKVDIPVGQRLTADLIEVELRPNTNVALQGGYIFTDMEDLLGRIVRVDVSEGQAILSPMIALNSTDLASFGSDLALYVDQGRVAVAFPLNNSDDDPAISTRLASLRGAAFAMRPGDFVDVMMTLRVVEIDPEFRSALPNITRRVVQSALLEGGEFLFEETVEGRLEFIPLINQVAEIVPGGVFIEGQDFEAGSPIPKRVTQLTIQQSEVLWVGTWRDQSELQEALQPTPAPIVATEDGGEAEEGAAGEAADNEVSGETICLSPVSNELVPCPIVRESNRPDIVILSMTSQDALSLKWALERGLDIDLALRAQGDTTIFLTTSVSLPQIVNEGGLAVPPDSDFDVHPRADEVIIPALPPEGPAD